MPAEADTRPPRALAVALPLAMHDPLIFKLPMQVIAIGQAMLHRKQCDTGSAASR
jgi:hypothetical protein